MMSHRSTDHDLNMINKYKMQNGQVLYCGIYVGEKNKMIFVFTPSRSGFHILLHTLHTGDFSERNSKIKPMFL